MRVLTLMLMAAFCSVAQAQSSGQKAVATRLTSDVPILKQVTCPKMPGDPFGLATSICLKAAGWEVIDVTDAITSKLASKLEVQEWHRISSGLLNHWTSGDNYFPLAVFNYQGQTYLRISRGFLSSQYPTVTFKPKPSSPVAPMSAAGKRAINQILIDVQAVVEKCGSASTEKICATSPLSTTTIKAVIAVNDLVVQREPWEKIRDMVVTNFDVDGKPHMIILSPSGDGGTFIQWFRNY